MQVDFYQLTRDPAEKILTALAQKTLSDKARLLVVSGTAAQLEAISKALWSVPGAAFLAHAISDGGAADALQPILLSDQVKAPNDAKFIAIADGIWREEALTFDRVFYLFPPERTDNARAAWRALGEAENVTRNYWRQDGGKWIKGP
ncbi:DNA polymerase III subunit chi [Sphingorhabdus arenilitoris]|uniref:DNA polymerase III subunit chi n=1 Tax=Sphingorhabdus arenilitoris TaxID=1490041 RepID=A0ABV8RH18_9SPHN